jgi:hypothetical protein
MLPFSSGGKYRPLSHAMRPAGSSPQMAQIHADAKQPTIAHLRPSAPSADNCLYFSLVPSRLAVSKTKAPQAVDSSAPHAVRHAVRTRWPIPYIDIRTPIRQAHAHRSLATRSSARPAIPDGPCHALPACEPCPAALSVRAQCEPVCPASSFVAPVSRPQFPGWSGEQGDVARHVSPSRKYRGLSEGDNLPTVAFLSPCWLRSSIKNRGLAPCG